ncbi:MAG: hypothetical protein LUD72_05730 [Bacteroidales bacterium]|nr:hypothetical protein [Bacteroidales bacterium]
MKMKRAVSYILASVVVVLLAAYLVFFLGMAERRQSEQVCVDVRIVVADSVANRYITSSDVVSCIVTEYGGCKGRLVKEVDLERIEDLLRAKNAVLGAEAYFTPDGVLNVDVVQRIPAVRFRNDEADFYVDGDCYVFHLQTGGAVPVMTVEGSFPVEVEPDFQGVMPYEAGGKWIGDMLAFSRALKRSGMGSGVKIAVMENGDIVLKPSDESPQFVFGRPENFESKFARMGEYYSAIVPKEGAETYSTVILKYGGQIVCRK